MADKTKTPDTGAKLPDIYMYSAGAEKNKKAAAAKTAQKNQLETLRNKHHDPRIDTLVGRV